MSCGRARTSSAAPGFGPAMQPTFAGLCQGHGNCAPAPVRTRHESILAFNWKTSRLIDSRSSVLCWNQLQAKKAKQNQGLIQS